MSLPAKPREMDYSLTSPERLAPLLNTADALCNHAQCTETFQLLEGWVKRRKPAPSQWPCDAGWMFCQLTGRSPVLPP